MKRLLQGVKVVDFTWIGAGSYTTKLLADLGADVIKIETSERLDSLRLARPFKDKIQGVNRSGYFADRNSSKRSITVNVKREEGLALVKQLIKAANLVTNNFTPGVMEKLGLGYDVLRALRPGIVYAAMSMQGRDGPDRGDLGYGLTIGAITGIQHLTGLPDRDPAGTGTNFPDHIPNPTHTAFAILAALRHQRRTGQGQAIDIAQTEPTLALLGPSIMNCLVNGVVDNRRGNSHPQMAPHGVYPCHGDDRWIAIAVNGDPAWQALRGELDLPDAAQWRQTQGRLADRAALDEAMALATREREPVALMEALQRAGVAAGVVQDARDVLQHDPQLAARGHWITLIHPEVGPSTYNSAPFRFSDAESSPSAPAPLLGQHTREICGELLGLDAADIDRLAAAGVLA
jgi:crotonobetainyl-CoA:carnitine CoA-transferase CaiB-like acyl-CoA transferase